MTAANDSTPEATLIARLNAMLRMVKIEHSIFALPFAYMGSFLAADGWPGVSDFLLVTVAMVAARSFAMAANRVIDLDIDRENPRTASRPLVTGEITPGLAKLFMLVTAVIFIAACAAMNLVCLAASVPALALAAFYSHTKRFTWLCHFILGATLGLAPLGGWIAVDPTPSIQSLLFSLGVLFWVAGFDILYAMQDEDFDREMGLHSAPSRLGRKASLALSGLCHANTALFFFLGGWAAGLSWSYFVGLVAVCAALAWEHALITEHDISRMDMAFFTLNGFIAPVMFAITLSGIYF